MEECTQRRTEARVEATGSILKTTGPPPTTTKAQHTTDQLSRMGAGTPREVISLLDMPPEILFMIFDYAACRDHLKDPHYPIRLKNMDSSDYGIMISQPVLLSVSKSLRTALSHYFYSSCTFHAKIEARSLLEGTTSGLTIQGIDDRLPYPLKLRTIRLTIDSCRLHAGGFDAALVEVGKKLFHDYRAKKFNNEDRVKLMDSHWRLVCTDKPRLSHKKASFAQNLQFLLREIILTAARSAALEPYNLQEFGLFLQTWLDEDGYFKDPRHPVKAALWQFGTYRSGTGSRNPYNLGKRSQKPWEHRHQIRD